MYTTMSHWKVSRMSNGKIIPAGEDCYPYADGNLLIVADGLGGRGGFPHRKIKAEVLQREKFYDIFAKGVFGETDDEFKNFVLESFSELFELRECYFTDSTTMRTSGYFASRITTAVVLYECKYNPNFDRASIFGKVRELSEEDRKKFLSELGTKLAETVWNKNTMIADNLGLELESKIVGTYLLPSTLVVAIAEDKEEDVEALYFWAGDSRGYVWDKNGLAQVTDDHEKNEAMTNLVSITKPFGIEVAFKRFAKPVVLFNATDGCYKCPVFASPFDLECVLLNAITGTDNLVDTAQILRDTFKKIGTHDDSNTMSLVTFGFEDFATLKNAANARMSEIQKTIIDKLPNILVRDYQGELDRLDAQYKKFIEPFRDNLFDIPAVKEYIKTHSEEYTCSAYQAEVASVCEEEAGLDKSLDVEKESILQWVKANWLRAQLSGSGGKDRSKTDQKQYIAYKKKEEKLSAVKTDYDKSGGEVFGKLCASYDELDKRRDDFTTFDAALRCDETEKILACIAAMHNSLKKLEKSLKKMIRMRKVERDLIETSTRWIEEDIESIRRFAESLVSRESEVDKEKIPVAQYRELEPHLEACKRIEQRKEELAHLRSDLLEKYIVGIWQENLVGLLSGIAETDPGILPEEVREGLVDKLTEYGKKRAELVELLGVREKLYAEYNVSYRRYFEESTL